ncbi:DCC1-like thiol-disulfide oxidoreductase family protein [Flavobacterium paronense]|uniref:Thiol-disulfide oxidoreductase DCC family protein n=1 Tax=Flavobacterium paronense TaxID=1392775 RepID=A0ABV5GGE3_9FLAO|nr:DCC1-like thiol-disulfide oxidoreductase family protein [Flavobacterium paronense]MDN3677089.1 DCC1-like thiol-disulfide oxidoreductase family protein [Flavobacterium paronense]
MEISDLPKDKKIILFDGVCNLCNSSVQFVIKHDKKDVFRFVALQSELGQKIIRRIDTFNIDSIILYEPEKGYRYKARAALEIVKHLSGAYRVLLVFTILPTSLLNRIYDFIAKNRYKWFGKKESCMIPTPDLANKFLV